MEGDERDADGVREFRLEGVSLVVVGTALTLALVGAFFVGRWSERSSQPRELSGAADSDPLGHVVEAEEPADLDESTTFFDTVDGDEKQAEPAREMASETPREAPARATEPPPTGGPYFVQVFAGRDRRAAEGLVARLQGAGYGVRLFSERSDGESLFKVRVGGYGTEAEARAASGRLVEQGYGGAWVTRVE